MIADTIRAEGSFLLHHFIHMFLKGNNAACVVGLDQSLFHYFNVARKLVRHTQQNTQQLNTTRHTTTPTQLKQPNHRVHAHSLGLQGVNLTTEHSKGTFTFINALSSPYSWIVQHEGW